MARPGADCVLCMKWPECRAMILRHDFSSLPCRTNNSQFTSMLRKAMAAGPHLPQEPKEP